MFDLHNGYFAKIDYHIRSRLKFLYTSSADHSAASSLFNFLLLKFTEICQLLAQSPAPMNTVRYHLPGGVVGIGTRQKNRPRFPCQRLYHNEVVRPPGVLVIRPALDER